MLKRLLGGGVAVTTLVVSTLALAPAPATADPSSTPSTTDIVGVGSDTSEFALNYLADGQGGTPGYNASNPTNKLVSWNATGTSPITLRSGSTPVTRPNGSGQGVQALYGAGNNNDVSYARSSSAIASIDPVAVSSGLQMLPFALDVLKTAVSPSSHAPTSLTRAQLLSIYKGTITNWSQVGGQPGVIKPYIPQSGSGTLKFFTAQLTAENGGTTFSYGPGVLTSQEHDDTLIKNDPDAIAPFSAGRAQLLGTVRLEGGFFANRALYNVVRGTGSFNITNPDIQAIFGPTGFVCSPAAAPLITAAGFTQLASSTHGGECGVATQSATSNFKTSGTATTLTSLTASQPSGTDVALLASVSGGSAPAGTVTFSEGATTLGAVALSGGQAALTVPAAAVGSHTYTASFAPSDNSAYTSSTGTQTFVVRQPTTVTTTMTPSAPYYGQNRSVRVAVGSPAGTPDGTVTVTVGSWSATRTLSAGTATVALPTTIAAGSRSVGASYAGSSTFTSSSTSKAFSVRKSLVKLSESFASKVAKRHRASGTVRALLLPSSSLRPTGKYTITRGSKRLAAGTLVRGARTVTLPALPKGRNVLVLRYGGSANSAARTLAFVIIQK